MFSVERFQFGEEIVNVAISFNFVWIFGGGIFTFFQWSIGYKLLPCEGKKPNGNLEVKKKEKKRKKMKKSKRKGQEKVNNLFKIRELSDIQKFNKRVFVANYIYY